MYNIFQGNNLINNTIIEGLKLEKTDRVRRDSQTYYFQAFFYLTKRFGMPKIYDDYKDGGVWTFTVKGFKIQILLDSVFVNFMIFGNAKYKNYSMLSPSLVARTRAASKFEKDDFFTYVEDENHKLSEKQQATNNKIWEAFCNEYNIDDTWTEERFKEEKMYIKWHVYIHKYEDKMIGVNTDEYIEKYGRDYKNSNIKYALKTLKQFLNNMLTPIWVRDCDFNILGRGGSEYKKYDNNIKIEFDVD